MKFRFIGNLNEKSSIGSQNCSIVNALSQRNLIVEQVNFLDESIFNVFEPNYTNFNIVEISNRPESLIPIILIPTKPTISIIHDLWLLEILQGKFNYANLHDVTLAFAETLDYRPLFLNSERIKTWMSELGWELNLHSKRVMEILGRVVFFSEAIITHSDWAKKVILELQDILRLEVSGLSSLEPSIAVVPLPEIPPTDLAGEVDRDQISIDFDISSIHLLVLGHQNSIHDVIKVMQIFESTQKTNGNIKLLFVGVLTREIRNYVKSRELYRSGFVRIFENLPGVDYKRMLKIAQGFIHIRTFVTEAASGTFSDIVSEGKPALVLRSGSRQDFIEQRNVQFIEKNTSVKKASKMLQELIDRKMNTIDPVIRISNADYGLQVASQIEDRFLNYEHDGFVNKIRTGYLLKII
jgi:hypothetical protein